MFEATLLERFRRTRRRRKAAAFSLAVVAHAVVLAGVTLARLWAIEELEEPPILVTFWLPPQPPPPPPAPPPPPKGAAAPRREQPKKEDVKPIEVVQPSIVPTAVPQAAAASEGDASGAASGVPGGAPGGVEGGVIGGEVGGAVGGVPGGLPGAPMRAGLQGIKEPRRLKYVRPAYTESARRKRTQGAVVLDVVIERDGSVGPIKVIMPLGDGLTESAIEAVKQWRYESTVLDSQPIAVLMIVTIQFSLL
jgi:periplasmic protein TonB